MEERKQEFICFYVKYFSSEKTKPGCKQIISQYNFKTHNRAEWNFKVREPVAHVRTYNGKNNENTEEIFVSKQI